MADELKEILEMMPEETRMMAQELEQEGVPLDTSIAAAVVLSLAVADTIAITPDDFIPILGFLDEAALWSAGGFLASRAAQGQSLDQAALELLP